MTSPSVRLDTADSGGSSTDSSDPKVLDLAVETTPLTHYMFRYPAKFHPPVVAALIEKFTTSSATIFDPFCGSGTLLVEAARRGRHSFGLDIDPLAVVVAQAKVLRLEANELSRSVKLIEAALGAHRRSADEYTRRMFVDLTEDEYAREAGTIDEWVPAIPNLMHWFRKYVVVDLAQIRRAICEAEIPETHRQFLFVVFASIIRNASNADPVPVSGLEVTKWMLEKEKAGRRIDPYALFFRAVDKAATAAKEFRSSTPAGVQPRVWVGDSTRLDSYELGVADAVITSPPYHGAVDYYRRHQLEMFWLGLTESQDDRLGILQQYIGRPKVPMKHPWVAEEPETALVKMWDGRIREHSVRRADAFRHYLRAMTLFFETLPSVLKSGGLAVLVVGHSSWNDSEIPTSDLFEEISGRQFELDDFLTYPVKNRYMSYERHNAANIGREYVLVLRRT